MMGPDGLQFLDGCVIGSEQVSGWSMLASHHQRSELLLKMPISSQPITFILMNLVVFQIRDLIKIF